MSSPSPSYVTAAGETSIASILIEDRSRKDTPEDREWIEESLVPSLSQFGIIQPPTVNQHELRTGVNIFGDDTEGTLTLVAGWSRMLGWSLLGNTTIRFNYSDSLPKSVQEAMEIEENLRRHDMRWQDVAKGTVRIHKLYTTTSHATGERWGQSQTGALLNVSAGHISYLFKVAKDLEAGDAEIEACETLAKTREVYAARLQDKARAELAKRTGHVATSIQRKKNPEAANPAPSSSTDSLLSDPSSSALLTKPVPKTVSTKVHKINLSNMLFNMDNKDWFAQQAPESFDGIYTDIPYGIDMDNLDMADIDRVSDEHDVDENIEQMQAFLTESYRILKLNSYLLFWMDLKHWEKLVSWGESAGFAVQPYPLLWIKTHECKNRAAHKWWTKSFECVMVMAKGKATISTPQPSCYHACSGKAERKLQNNPFAKPSAFTDWLLKPITLPGQKWADVYAGEGSLVRAMLNLGLNVTAVEKKPIHFNGLVEHVKKHFKQQLQGEVQFE